MALNYVELPFDYFPDFNKGRPLFGGKIYVGEVGTDPLIVSNQKQIYIQGPDDSASTPIAQPLDVGAGGVPSYNGTPVVVTVDGDYSILVLDKNDAQEYYYPSVRSGEPVTDSNFSDYLNQYFSDYLGEYAGTYTDYVFTDVNNLKSGTIGALNISEDIKTLIDVQDISASTIGYYGTYSGDKTPYGGANYVLSTLTRVKVEKGGFWVPDGYGDHYLFGGTEYVAVLLVEKEVDASKFGVISDGSTDNYDALTSALDSDAEVVIASGRVVSNGKIEIPEGKELRGVGIQDIYRYLEGFYSGTVFLVDSGDDYCIEPKINTDKFTKRGRLSNCSVFNTNAANTKGVFNGNGVLFFDAEDLLISSTVEIEGAGIVLEPTDFNGDTQTNGGHYKYWRNVSVDGKTCKVALHNRSNNTGYEGVNSTIFFGGRLVGWYKAYLQSTTAPSGPNNCVFEGTSFEGSYDSRQDIEFKSSTTRTLVGAYGLNRYLVKYIDIQAGTYPSYSGCRFEFGGLPDDYNDGVNGVAPIIGVVNVELAAPFASLVGCGWFSISFNDKSGTAQALPATNGVRYIGGKSTPYGQTYANSGQTFASEALQIVTWETPDILRQLTFEGGTGYRIQEAGTYNFDLAATLDGDSNSKYARISLLKNGTPLVQGSYEQFIEVSTGVYRAIPNISATVDVALGDLFTVRIYFLGVAAVSLNDFDDTTFFRIKKIN